MIFAVSTLGIVVLVILALLVVLFAGGLAANTRRHRMMSARLTAQLDAAESALSDARASDRGWDRAVMEAAATQAFSAQHAGRPLKSLLLVQVVDQPGTDSDQAVFRAQAADGGEETITLGRRDGAWIAL